MPIKFEVIDTKKALATTINYLRFFVYFQMELPTFPTHRYSTNSKKLYRNLHHIQEENLYDKQIRRYMQRLQLSGAHAV